MRVLLADFDAARAAAVESDLAGSGLATDVFRLQPGETLDQAMQASRPDVILVDMALPDRDRLESIRLDDLRLDGIRQVVANDPRPVVMFVDRDDTAFMEDAIAAGVSSYNVVGAELPDVKPIVKAAVAMFQRFHKIEQSLRRAEAVTEERRLVDRAKGVLIKRRGMAESEAYRWLRRRSMDQGRRIVEVARELLEAEEP